MQAHFNSLVPAFTVRFELADLPARDKAALFAQLYKELGMDTALDAVEGAQAAVDAAWSAYTSEAPPAPLFRDA